MAKQWTKDQKLLIIEYNKNHTSISTCTKFNISHSTLKRWKQELKSLGVESLEWGSGISAKASTKKRVKKQKEENINYENMSRNELIERAKFGDALKKYLIKSIKDKLLLIDSLKADFTIRFLCKMLNVSRFGYYKWKQNGSNVFNKWNQDLANKITNLYYGFNKVYGYNMISMLLFKIFKIKVKPYIVYRYMKNMNLKAIRRKRNFKYNIESGNLIYPNLLNRNFFASTCNKIWVTDITYILTNTKNYYLSIVRDLYNGEIIDYQLSSNLSFEFVYKNIICAWYKANKPKNVILHSDQGGHYTGEQYQKLCKQLEITISMSRRGNSVDNGACETWFSSFKQESIYSIPRKQINEQNISKIVDDYIEFYNFIRPMKKLKKMSPIEYRLAHY